MRYLQISSICTPRESARGEVHPDISINDHEMTVATSKKEARGEVPPDISIIKYHRMSVNASEENKEVKCLQKTASANVCGDLKRKQARGNKCCMPVSKTARGIQRHPQ